jgi:hypothetical protein
MTDVEGPPRVSDISIIRASWLVEYRTCMCHKGTVREHVDIYQYRVTFFGK